MAAEKILPFDQAAAVFATLRASGRRLVQCHGTFDLVHPGHILHLQEARAQGDVLVVTVTAEKFVNKGPGRPYFNDALRAASLAALECVDYVVLIPHAAAVEAIDLVRPHIYCKGKEYRDPANDVTGNISDDVKAVTRHGGEVRYLGDVVFSSTKLLNNHFATVSREVKDFCLGLSGGFGPDDILREVGRFDGLKVLVVGDVIFDRYTFLKVQGLTSKNRIISGRFLEEETQAGGALAIYRHLRQFTPHVKMLGLAGTEPWLEDLLRSYLPEEDDWILREDEFVSVIKQRFVEPVSEGKDMSKLFSVNYLKSSAPASAITARIAERLEAELPGFDLVVAADFGHGIMQPAVRNLLQDRAPFLALNCQTNSNNHGFNIINRQWRRADAFSLDEQELLLASGHRHVVFERELSSLREQLGARYAWLTRGAVETLGLTAGGESSTCPPLVDDVTDTIGAGDAFFSVVSLAAACGLPVALATFLGQLAGAQAVKIVGNRTPVSKASLLKAGMSLLNY